jgi:hypothetical protein
VEAQPSAGPTNPGNAPSERLESRHGTWAAASFPRRPFSENLARHEGNFFMQSIALVVIPVVARKSEEGHRTPVAGSHGWLADEATLQCDIVYVYHVYSSRFLFLVRLPGLRGPDRLFCLAGFSEGAVVQFA